MELLTELDALNQEMLTESRNALVFLKIERVASFLKDGGIPITVDNIVKFGFLVPKEVEQALRWITSGPKGVKLPFVLDSTSTAKSPLDQLKAGLLWMDSRGRLKRNGRPIPPADVAVVGVQRLMDLTGLGRVEILELVQAHHDDIVTTFPDFRDAWVNDSKEVLQKNAKNQHPETKIALIRQAIEEIAQGRIGMVTGEQLMRWQNGKIGLDKRQIDNLLSSSPALRDLDKYRAIGNRYRETDADREAAYNKARYA